MGTGNRLTETLAAFIRRQPLFYVATGDQTRRTDLSPKGMDTLRIVDDNRVLWLNLRGSGNETAAHVRATGRMTLMFCAFEGDALILRAFGQAKGYQPRIPEWQDLVAAFPKIAGSRQIFDLTIDLVQTSCGTGVPIMGYQRPRADTELVPFYAEMGAKGVEDFWRRKNTATIDGKPTGVFQDQ